MLPLIKEAFLLCVCPSILMCRGLQLATCLKKFEQQWLIVIVFIIFCMN